MPRPGWSPLKKSALAEMGLPLRFWSKVDRSGGPDACWLWTGGHNGLGYGRFKAKVGEWMVYAHRLVLEKKLGRAIGPGLQAMHSCDNPPCVNPAHLSEGTRLDNSRDCYAKGRGNTGERHGHAKLTDEKVRQILEDGGTHASVAARFGVARETVSEIKRGEAWRHIPRSPQ